MYSVFRFGVVRGARSSVLSCLPLLSVLSNLDDDNLINLLSSKSILKVSIYVYASHIYYFIFHSVVINMVTKINLEGHRDFFLSFPSKSQFIIERSQESKNYIRVILSGFFPWIMFLYNPGPSALAVNQSTIKIIHYKHNHGKNLSGKFFLLWQEHCIQKLKQYRCLTKTNIMITSVNMSNEKGRNFRSSYP